MGKSNLLLILVATLLAAPSRGQTNGDHEIRRDVQYALHDGVSLTGDFYSPNSPGSHPVVVAIHGGGWQLGSRTGDYQYWGAYLAKHGIAVFAISYRLSKPGEPSYPKNVRDVAAAIQFLKHNADSLRVDPGRVGLIGNSAGAHLAALVALGGADAPFAGGYPRDPYANVSTSIKAVVGVYGVYDLVQQWNHDLVTRPRDQIVERLLGTTPMDDRRTYFEASPISYAVHSRNSVSFFLSWGTGDDMASPSQSEDFLLALKQAGFYVRTAPVPGAPHFWMGMPMDSPGSHSGFIAPQVLRFLQDRL